MTKTYSYKKELVTGILSESFDTNLSVNYVVKQDNSRKARIKKLMDYSFEVCNAFGEVWISDDEQACALILLPDKKRITLNSLLWDAKLALSVIGLSRIGSVLGRETRIKSFHPKDPFCYLWFIGVKPDLQGKGKGSILLDEIIKDAERKQRPIYLETSADKNLPWYKKHGFEIFNTINLTYTLYLLRKVNGHS